MNSVKMNPRSVKILVTFDLDLDLDLILSCVRIFRRGYFDPKPRNKRCKVESIVSQTGVSGCW